MSDYKLAASLAGHDDDVRAVSFPHSKFVLSTSRDATVRQWKLLSSPPPRYDGTITSHGSSFVNAVTYIHPSDTYPDGLIVSGGKDMIIEVRQPGKPVDDSADALLIGHASNICALDADKNGRYIVSGGWDKQARIWNVGKWETETMLEGHEASVWAVLAYDDERVITGCADTKIRIFHTSGKLMKTIDGGNDVVRALCRVYPGHPSGAEFASAGNDGIIRLWNFQGTELATLHGHDNFIYSLAPLPNGELVSAGEDRTVRIWKDEHCIQTITHPAISVWSVASCYHNGDIVTGASDNIVRVFSRSTDRFADAETVAQFEDSVRSSAIPAQQAGDVNKEKLPGPEFLIQKSGTKEGQIQMIREGDGSVTVHQWSMSSGWINVGTMVDAVGSSGKKTAYLGKEYDYVFDVDIEDGKPPLKLPFNLSQNPYEAATKFIADNELPMSYLDQVANFITTNTQGATLGQSQSQGPAPPGSDPWGSESRYRPGETSSSTSAPAQPKVLPQKEYLTILVARVDSMQKKIEELNQKLINNGQKNVALDDKGIETLRSVCKHLASAGATKSSQNVDGGLELAIKLVTEWPYSDRLPGLDLARLLTVAPNTATYTNPQGGDIVDILEASVTEAHPAAENSVMMAIRAFANLFESAEGRTLALSKFDKIQALTASAINEGTKNRNLLVAATTLYINYAVLFSSTKTQNPDEIFERALTMLEILGKVLSTQADSEVVYRAMVSTGTLVTVGPEVLTAAREIYGIDKCITTAFEKASDPRIKNVAKEIRALA